LEFHPLAPFDGQLRRLLDRLAIETLRDWHCHAAVAVYPQPVGGMARLCGDTSPPDTTGQRSP
jgi:hypothetical protein